ncbi:MAG: amidase domain-containing protein [Sporolactobacillus sp.]
MEWQKLFEQHLRSIGDWWVSDARRFELHLADREQLLMQRKKDQLHEKNGVIQKAIIQATIAHLEQKREDELIAYGLLTQWFIQQNNEFFLEERSEERQAILRNQKIVADDLKPVAKSEEAEWTAAKNETNADKRAPQHPRVYDRLGAVRYADLWWNRRNPAFPVVENDCTNFISQCLYAGGIPMWGMPVRNRGWWQQQTNWSFSWTVANSLRWYLSSSGNIIGTAEVEQADQLVPGDVICYDFEGDGNWNHNTMVTSIDPSGEPLVNAHTYDTRNRPWPYTDSPAWTEKIQYKFFHILDEV